MQPPLALAPLLAALLTGCFPPKPAAERPLSYRAPIPGWVRHDVDSTLSLLLPPELERQPRADTAFAPVFFVSDSMRLIARFGPDATAQIRALGTKTQTQPLAQLRNGNYGSFLPYRPAESARAGLAVAYLLSDDRPRPGFNTIFHPPGEAFRPLFCPNLTVLITLEQTPEEAEHDRIWDYVRFRCPTRPPNNPSYLWRGDRTR